MTKRVLGEKAEGVMVLQSGSGSGLALGSGSKLSGLVLGDAQALSSGNRISVTGNAEITMDGYKLRETGNMPPT